MNKKGYTLVEVIVSISILSIASITLAGAFGTIIHFMTKSNQVKEASNEMYKKIESNEANAKVKELINNPGQQYEIDVNGTKLYPTGTFIYNQYEENDEVHLAQFKNTYIKTINATDVAKEMYNAAKKYETNIVVCENCSVEGYIEVFNKIKEDYQNDFPQFPKEKLPLNIVTNQYIKIYYPWELKNGQTIKHGQPFIYLSEFSTSEQIDESIKIFFNYEDNCWYYLQAGTLKIDTTQSVNAGNGNNRSLKLNERGIDNWGDLLNDIKSNKTNWLKWDENSGKGWVSIS